MISDSGNLPQGARGGAAQTPTHSAHHDSLREFVGAEIRHLRLAAGLSLRELGRRVIVSEDLLAKVEKAVRRPQPDLLTRLDAEFGTNGWLSRLGALLYQEPPGQVRRR